MKVKIVEKSTVPSKTVSDRTEGVYVSRVSSWASPAPAFAVIQEEYTGITGEMVVGEKFSITVERIE